MLEALRFEGPSAQRRTFAPQACGFEVFNAVVKQKVFLESNKCFRLCTFANVLNPLGYHGNCEPLLLDYSELQRQGHEVVGSHRMASACCGGHLFLYSGAGAGRGSLSCDPSGAQFVFVPYLLPLGEE